MKRSHDDVMNMHGKTVWETDIEHERVARELSQRDIPGDFWLAISTSQTTSVVVER
jgi:hypothetical protein